LKTNPGILGWLTRLVSWAGAIAGRLSLQDIERDKRIRHWERRKWKSHNLRNRARKSR
jgi:hypothetical protein